ncbi:MAG: hypothetical protein ABI614_09175 [Planctomycetota bacterium]
MSGLRDQLEPQAQAYAAEKRILLLRFLGDGNDGAVWESNRESAVKVLERPDSYQRERDAYLRLGDRNVTEIEGFAVPALIDHHDTLQVVEMTIVFPPRVLDFAKSYVDHPPDYPAEALSDWEAEIAEDFGESKWPTVQSILGWLRTYGIHYFDARPGNIRFQEGDE